MSSASKSSIQLESLVDRRQGSVVNGRYARLIVIVAVLIGIALLGTVFFSGLLHYSSLSSGHSPMPTSLQLRPDYPVSTFLYKRDFLWNITVATSIIAGAVAIAGLAPACIAVTGGLMAWGCVAAAIGVVGTVLGAFQSAVSNRVAKHRLHLSNLDKVYMDYVDKSARDINPAQQFLDSVFGYDYRFEGNITHEDEHNRHLVERNGGPVPVFSFTAPNGLSFHHVMIEGENTMFHRFGFPSSKGTTKRQSFPSNEYFKSGGLDVLDCAVSAGKMDHLVMSDHNQMEDEIKCAIPNLGKETEIAIQILDYSERETMGAGRIAPVNSDGQSIITMSQFASCPVDLTNGKSCPKQRDGSCEVRCLMHDPGGGGGGGGHSRRESRDR